jgi:hypothetical protein
MPTLQPTPGPSPSGPSLRSVTALTVTPTYGRGEVFQGNSTSITSGWKIRRRGAGSFRLPAHRPAGDLAHLVLDSPASIGTLPHGGLVDVDQEGRCRRAFREPLLPSYACESVEVLACPVDVHATGDAVPLLIRCLGSALRTTHGRTPCSLVLTAPPSWSGVLPGRFQRRELRERHRLEGEQSLAETLARGRRSPVPGVNECGRGATGGVPAPCEV